MFTPIETLIAGTPVHVDEHGNAFWPDADTTDYAHDRGLPDEVVVCIVREPSGRVTRLITYRGQPVYENQSLEAVACRLDLMKAFPDTYQEPLEGSQ